MRINIEEYIKGRISSIDEEFNNFCKSNSPIMNAIKELPKSDYSDKVKLFAFLSKLVKFKNKFCPTCEIKKVYFEQYDTYGCIHCDTWLEDMCDCDAAECKYVGLVRPDKPSEVPNDL